MKGLVVFSCSGFDGRYCICNVTYDFESSKPSMEELNYITNRVKMQNGYESAAVINVIPLAYTKKED